jgi:hypothetical protein
MCALGSRQLGKSAQLGDAVGSLLFALVPVCPAAAMRGVGLSDGAQLRAPLVAEAGLAWRRWWGGGPPTQLGSGESTPLPAG